LSNSNLSITWVKRWFACATFVALEMLLGSLTDQSSFGLFSITLNHRDKTRVYMPAKMFPHLKLLCWLFMGPTLGFDTKQRNIFLIKFGVFYKYYSCSWLKMRKSHFNDECVGVHNQQVFCMFKWGKKINQNNKGCVL
jgi:hypothetical protein